MNIHRLTLCIILCLASIAAAAQISAPTLPDEVGTGRIPGARGYYYTDIDGEEVKMIVLNDVVVYPPLKFKNKKRKNFIGAPLGMSRKHFRMPNSSAQLCLKHTSISKLSPLKGA